MSGKKMLIPLRGGPSDGVEVAWDSMRMFMNVGRIERGRGFKDQYQLQTGMKHADFVGSKIVGGYSRVRS